MGTLLNNRQHIARMARSLGESYESRKHPTLQAQYDFQTGQCVPYESDMNDARVAYEMSIKNKDSFVDIHHVTDDEIERALARTSEWQDYSEEAMINLADELIAETDPHQYRALFEAMGRVGVLSVTDCTELQFRHVNNDRIYQNGLEYNVITGIARVGVRLIDMGSFAGSGYDWREKRTGIYADVAMNAAIAGAPLGEVVEFAKKHDIKSSSWNDVINLGLAGAAAHCASLDDAKEWIEHQQIKYSKDSEYFYCNDQEYRQRQDRFTLVMAGHAGVLSDNFDVLEAKEYFEKLYREHKGSFIDGYYEAYDKVEALLDDSESSARIHKNVEQKTRERFANTHK